VVGATLALGMLIPFASLATNGNNPVESSKQEGEDRWVPSLAITSGITIQEQEGSADSVLTEDIAGISLGPLPLRGFVRGDDLTVSPFVGGSLELMTPALPIPTRPRLFVSGEIVPTFASDRDLVIEGDPSCIRGPEPGIPCAIDELTELIDGDEIPIRDRGFGEDSVNGQGSRTTAQIDTLVIGLNLGAAFPLQVGKRQFRIKPSVGWINYKVEAEGMVTDAACDPTNRCTDIRSQNFVPPPAFLVTPGFLRETTLTASGSQRFNAIGPGLDIEMDTGRYGPLGVSLFMGGRAYAVVGNRKISFSTSETFTDQISDPGVTPPVKTDRAVARFEVEVDRWIFRAHVGIRFHWLGYQE